MEKKVREFIKDHALIGAGQKVGVAVSGGPDSMALLHCLSQLALRDDFSVCAVHFEHGIRGEQSLDDADFVSRYCEENRIAFLMGTANVPYLADFWGVSKQTAAKRAREEYFARLKQNGNVDVIATAHHADDNAESVLMHILRGSGLDGLVGIHVRREFLVRPFLCIDKAEIYRYLEREKIDYCTDASNDDNEYTRNYLRNEIFPLLREHVNTDVCGALCRLSLIAEQDLSLLQAQAQAAYESCARREGDTVIVELKRLNELQPSIAVRVVRLAAQALNITTDLEKAHFSTVLRLAQMNKTGTRVNLSQGLCAEVEYGKMLVRVLAREVDHSFCMPLDFELDNRLPNGDKIVCSEVECCAFDGDDPYTEFLDADKLPRNLVIRTRYAGDVISPLGMQGTKKLKDYFIDKKLPREARDSMPLLADGERIVWAVGQTIDDHYCVTQETQRILRLQYIKQDEEETCNTM